MELFYKLTYVCTLFRKGNKGIYTVATYVHAMQVPTSLLYSYYFWKVLSLTDTNSLLYKVGLKLKFKSVWVAMCSLMMNLSSRDFLIKYYLPWHLIYSS